MKVVGLISGGKDSIYNLQLCQDQGHEVVALANLLPEHSDVDELDSFMYQTVGHQLVENYAACTNLRLFRKRISGTPKQADLTYSQVDGDEVEDLFTLLAYVKHCIPGLDAVSSGAIASTYQRTRVENVASRLGLVSLSYLWMQPQNALLLGMIDSGINAILVKVAALGLEPHKHLGKTLQQMEPTLHKLARQFGCNVCGEGGEYETLTLDCRLFTHARIILKDWSMQLHSPGDLASVGVLHPLDFLLEPKGYSGGLQRQSEPSDSPQNTLNLRNGAAVNGEVQGAANRELSGRVLMVPENFQAREAPSSSITCSSETAEQSCIHYMEYRGFLSILAWWGGPSNDSAEAGFDEEAFCAILTSLGNSLNDGFGVSLKEAVLVQINLVDMSHFAAMNGVYRQFFPLARPAARACVQHSLPVGQQFTVELLVDTQEQSAASGPSREVLHVQSISHWAPSCIGPYSQAVRVQSLLFMAGQIGLDPPTMQLLPTMEAQILQSFRSCQAIATAMRVNLHSSVLTWKLYSSPSKLGAAAALHETLQNLWTAILDEGLDNDDECQDSYLRVPSAEKTWDPLCTYLLVPALPRCASVEVQPLLCSQNTAGNAANDSSSSSSEEDETKRKGWTGQLQRLSCSNIPAKHGYIAVEHLQSIGQFLSCNVSAIDEQMEARASAEGKGSLQVELQGLMKQLSEAAGDALATARLESADVFSIHVYYRADLLGDKASTASLMTAALAHVRGQALRDVPPISCLPVLSVGTTHEMKAAVLLELIASNRPGCDVPRRAMPQVSHQ